MTNGEGTVGVPANWIALTSPPATSPEPTKSVVFSWEVHNKRLLILSSRCTNGTPEKESNPFKSVKLLLIRVPLLLTHTEGERSAHQNISSLPPPLPTVMGKQSEKGSRKGTRVKEAAREGDWGLWRFFSVGFSGHSREANHLDRSVSATCPQEGLSSGPSLSPCTQWQKLILFLSSTRLANSCKRTADGSTDVDNEGVWGRGARTEDLISTQNQRQTQA